MTSWTEDKRKADNLLLLQLELADEALDMVLKKYEDLMRDIQGLVNLYAVGNMDAEGALNAILNRVIAEQQERDYHSKELDKSIDSGYAELDYIPSEYEYGIGLSAKRGTMETTR